MIVAAAFCPQAPVLVPALSRGAHAELRALAEAITGALRRALEPAERVVLLGAGPASAVYPSSARASLHGFGLDAEVTLSGPPADAALRLPDALAVGAWLLHDVDPHRPAVAVSVGDGDWAGSAAAAAAVDLVASEVPHALVVLGDGSARRTLKAPGYLDERAADHDAAVATALGSGDPDALAGLDADLGRDLLAAGVPAWRQAGELLAPGPWTAQLLHESDPYGVEYLVALWTPPPT